MSLKKEFNVVFQPIIEPGAKRKRFMISANRLADYLGQNWADYLLEKMLNVKDDKKRFIIRNKGIVDAYRR